MKAEQVQEAELLSPEEQKTREEGPRSFVNFLSRLSDGEAESELSYQLHVIGKRIQEVSKATFAKAKGKLVLEINMVADTDATVRVTYAVSTKEPKMPTTPAVWWLTKGGNLSPTDTRQIGLFPKAVGGEKKAPRDLPGKQARDIDDEGNL